MSIAKNKLVNLEDAQILYNDLRQRIESGGGGGGQQFMVTITEDSDTLSSDKTATQIINAIEAGNTLYVSYTEVSDTPTFAIPLGYVNDPEGDGIGVGLLILVGLTEWYIFDIRDDDGSTVVQVDSLDIVSGKANQTELATVEASTTASKAYAIGDTFVYDGKLYKATAAITQGSTIVTSGAGANCAETTVEEIRSQLKTEINGKYTKPQTGIPASDLASGVIPTVHNVPSGGSTGQILAKSSGTDYAMSWVDKDPVVNVSGTTPSITGVAGTRYICGEVATLTIVVPASGIIDVTFDSGSTPTVLTVTSAKSGVTAIKWANGFDPTSLDADTTYEINIADGEFGAVGSWT